MFSKHSHAIVREKGLVSRSKLPYLPLCTTRGSHPLSTSSHSDSVSHHSSYLGLIDLPHLHIIPTHTYKQHTSTHSLRSLDLPRLSLLSVSTRVCVSRYYLCLVPRLCDPSLVAPTRTVSLDSDIRRLPWLFSLFTDHASALSTLLLFPVIDPVLFDYSNKH